MDSFLEGEVADTGTSLPGCAFHPRCPVSVAACRDDVPELLEHDDGRLVSCHLCTHKPIEESTVELSQI
jgi:oligopeptide/dipeptide ABC transporter ATP-binding protein